MKSSPSSSEGALTSLRGLDLPLNRGGTANSRRSNGAPNAPPTLDTFLANLGDPGRFQVRKNILVVMDCLCEQDPLFFKFSYLPGDGNKCDPERENWPCRVMLPILPIQSISGSRLLSSPGISA